MSKVIVYICGNQDEFIDTSKVYKRLKILSCEVINPNEKVFGQMSFYDRHQLIKKCNAIYVLPNWQQDVMTRIELNAGIDMGLPILYHPVTNKEIKQLITTLDS